jgi:glucosylceramidase
MRNIARVAALAHLALVGCAPRTVEVYVTTGDRSKLLSREPDLSFSAAGTTLPTIVLDEGTSYQEIVGFGAALTDASAWLIEHQMSPQRREALLQELFGREPGLGLSFVRIDMGASDFALRDYSYDDVPPISNFSIDADRAETLPILKRALAINPRLLIMASPWSAPGWMKTTGSMIKGTLRPDAYGAYAEYFRRFVDAYAAEGVPIYAITAQNEPHFEPADYPGMRLDPAQRALFVRQYLGPALAGKTRILEWDHNWDEPSSPLAVLADSLARRYLSGVAWHCYNGEVSAQSVVHDAYPDKDAYVTECSGGDWAPKFADNLAWMTRTLIIGGTRNWARGVLLWNLALDEQHGPHTGGCGNCRGVVTIRSDGTVQRNEEYYALAHASRFVRPGARRVASSSAAGGIESAAFRNGDGSRILIVVNINADATTFVVRAGGRAFRYALPAGAVATFRF